MTLVGSNPTQVCFYMLRRIDRVGQLSHLGKMMVGNGTEVRILYSPPVLKFMGCNCVRLTLAVRLRYSPPKIMEGQTDW